MIKGQITRIERNPDETHYVQDRFGINSQIIGRRGRTTITFEVSEMTSDMRGVDFTSGTWVIVPVKEGVIAENPEPQKADNQKQLKEFGTW